MEIKESRGKFTETVGRLNFSEEISITQSVPKKTTFKNPRTQYLNIIIQGYKDCKLDEKYLNKALKPSW